MLAAVLKDFNNLVLEEVPTPTPGPGEVLVRIKSCGFCATDSKAIKGIRRNVTFPLIPGHEPSGVIAAVGPGVTHFKEGDEVLHSQGRRDFRGRVGCWRRQEFSPRPHCRGS